MKDQRDLGFWKLWNLSFGFFGVQIAYALQSSSCEPNFPLSEPIPTTSVILDSAPPHGAYSAADSRLCERPHVQTCFGRRLPFYLPAGAAVAIIAMCFLPNAGSPACLSRRRIIFGLVMFMLLDTSINHDMQPFKMLVGDMVNEARKALLTPYSRVCAMPVRWWAMWFRSCWRGSSSNTAPAGEVPATVTWAFYLGAFIYCCCAWCTPLPRSRKCPRTNTPHSTA